MAKEEEGLDPIEGVTAEMLQSAFKNMDMDLTSQDDVKRFAMHFEKQAALVNQEARERAALEMQKNLNAQLKADHDAEVADARKRGADVTRIWQSYQMQGYGHEPHPEWVNMNNPEHRELFNKHRRELYAEALKRTVHDVKQRVFDDWQESLRVQKANELSKIQRGNRAGVTKIITKYRGLGLRDDTPNEFLDYRYIPGPQDLHKLQMEYESEISQVPRGSRTVIWNIKRKYRNKGLNV